MKKDIYKTWQAAEKSMLKWDGRLTQFNRELVLQPLRVHEIYKKGLNNGVIFVGDLQRFNRLFNTYVQIQNLTIKRRKVMRTKEEQDLTSSSSSLHVNCKQNGDSKFCRINDYIMLFTQGAK